MTSIEAIINRQFRQWELARAERKEAPQPPPSPPPIVTVSRENGSRGAYFAQLLADRLGYQFMHREIIDTIASSTGYRRRVIESLDEHYRSQIELMVETVLYGQAVDHSDYVRNLCVIVLSMSELGGVVLVGRGGNFILGPQRGFHLRFVCPKERRAKNLMNYKGFTREQAEADIARLDAERKEFVRKVFGKDIDNPHHYDMVINAAFLDIEDMVEGIMAAIKNKTRLLSEST